MTHNDSGDGAFIYAINEKGEQLGTWKVTGAKNYDWEDAATYKDKTGKCFLFIADTGNNNSVRNTLTIYKVVEPSISPADKKSTKASPQKTEKAEPIDFSYPGQPPDAETLLVHPLTGEIYILTKPLLEAAVVYKIGKTTVKIGEVAVPASPNGLLTGGEISPDGKRVILCDYYAAYELILPSNSKKFDDIWKQEPLKVELGKRKQGEAICYSADGNSIFATSEMKNSPIIRVDIMEN